MLKLLAGAILLTAGAVLLLRLLASPVAAEPASTQPKSLAGTDEDRFWALVQASARDGASSDVQIARLRASLNALTVPEIEAFQRVFDEKLAQAYSWDLWGAAYVIHGGASDDGFEYFRRWLISRGRQIFDTAMADPDSLAELIPEDPPGALENEEIGFVAMEIWARKTGRGPAEMPGGANIQAAEPSGVPFEEEEEALARRYPRLWRRFGSDPIS